MFQRLGKSSAFFASAMVLGAMVTPVTAADYHGQGGNVFYRGMHGTPHGFQGGGFAGGAANGHNPHFSSRFQRSADGHGGFEHVGAGSGRDNRGLMAQNDMFARHRNRFDHRGGNSRVHANHLPSLASRDFSTRRGGGITVISRTEPDYDFISNYAGAVDVHHANGGTYITGYGDGGDGYQQQISQPMRPRAKIIDVARMQNSCAYENGVCVIRP